MTSGSSADRAGSGHCGRAPAGGDPSTRRRSWLAASALLAVTVLSGCSDDAGGTAPPAPSPSDASRAITTYVALGDSYSAAPYVPVTDFAEGCLRSSGNFASLAAAELGAELTDVSCSGAETSDITGPQTVGLGFGRVPPQLEAVTPDADLVTVSIGGNDEDVFATLVQECTRLAEQPGAPCRTVLRTRFGPRIGVLAVIGRRVTRALEAVQQAAPEAQVALVGYLRIISGTRGCPGIPLAAQDRPFLADLERRLNQALHRAAIRAGALFVDMRAASRGHEICSAEPWVNGRTTDESRALAFHPFAEGQEAVASELVSLLGER